MNERHTQEDFETLRKAQFVYEERMRHVESERAHLYTTEYNREILDEIELEIIAERKKIFIALGLEEPDTDMLY